MAEVIHLNGKRSFSLEEAKKLLPVVKRLTASSMQQTETLLFKMESLKKDSSERKELEALLNQVIETWVQRIERLGCEAKGLWLVDFDSGSGYYCWQYGEDEISFFHGYTEGFGGRRPIETAKEISSLLPRFD